MNELEFDQLLTFWSLKGKMQMLDNVKMGFKTVAGSTQTKMMKALLIDSNGNHAKVVYSKVMEDDVLRGYEIEYADITNNRGISTLYRNQAEALTAVQKM